MTVHVAAGDDLYELLGERVRAYHADGERTVRTREPALGPFDVAAELVDICRFHPVLRRVDGSLRKAFLNARAQQQYRQHGFAQQVRKGSPRAADAELPCATQHEKCHRITTSTGR